MSKPITVQPQTQPLIAAQWVPSPTIPINCPPGLEYLSTVDQLLVHQKIQLIEAFTEFEANNKYMIKNSMGQSVYAAFEDNDCCTRNFCGPIRPFDMKILDHDKREVLHLYRPFRCASCWCPCYLQRLEVMASGNTIGNVIQEWSLLKPRFRIENESGECVFRIEGPLCPCSLCCDVEFQVLTNDGLKHVGKITKQWAGLAQEIFTDADFFGISFPQETDVKNKALLLSACFLIDFMFFEKSKRRNAPQS